MFVRAPCEVDEECYAVELCEPFEDWCLRHAGAERLDDAQVFHEVFEIPVVV